MSGVYNYHIKVANPNLRNDIPQMESEGFQPPFFFGGSQVPISLGIEKDISGAGMKKIKRDVDKKLNQPIVSKKFVPKLI